MTPARRELSRRFTAILDDRWPLAGKLLAAVDEYSEAEAALDVKLLAEATWNVGKRNWEEKGARWPTSFSSEANQSIWIIEAERIAAEYARLASEPKP